MKALALFAALSLAAPAAAQTAGGFSAQQLPGKKFRIAGTVSPPGPGTGVVLSGAALGTLAADAGGTVAGVFTVAAVGAVTATPGNGSGFGPPVTFTLTNAPPSVTVLSAAPLGNGLYRLTGTAADDTPAGAAGLTVWTSAGSSCVVAADGTWAAIVPGRPGQGVWASVADWYGLAGQASAVLP